MFYLTGARCSSMLRAFAHGAMRSLDLSFMMEPFSYFSFQPVLHVWCIKSEVSAILSVGSCV